MQDKVHIRTYYSHRQVYKIQSDNKQHSNQKFPPETGVQTEHPQLLRDNQMPDNTAIDKKRLNSGQTDSSVVIPATQNTCLYHAAQHNHIYITVHQASSAQNY